MAGEHAARIPVVLFHAQYGNGEAQKSRMILIGISVSWQPKASRRNRSASTVGAMNAGPNTSEAASGTNLSPRHLQHCQEQAAHEQEQKKEQASEQEQETQAPEHPSESGEGDVAICRSKIPRGTRPLKPGVERRPEALVRTTDVTSAPPRITGHASVHSALNQLLRDFINGALR